MIKNPCRGSSLEEWLEEEKLYEILSKNSSQTQKSYTSFLYNENLALKKLMASMDETFPEISHAQLLNFMSIAKTYGKLSVSYLMKTLKCSEPVALKISKALRPET